MFHSLHELKFSHLKCMIGTVFMLLERFIFSLDFLLSLLPSLGD